MSDLARDPKVIKAAQQAFDIVDAIPFARVEEEITTEWRVAKDQAKREELHFELQAISRLKRRLQTMISDGKLEMKKDV